MAELHLTKVAFACRDYGALERRIARRSAQGETRIATARRPRRADELPGGYLCWIIAHHLCAGQRILRFEDRADGRIDIVCDSRLVGIGPIARRAHQGWRYFEGSVGRQADGQEGDSARSAEGSSGADRLPPQLYLKLSTLALL